VSPENLEAKSRNEWRLKPFTFRTLDGISFQYTIESVQQLEDWQKLEEASLVRTDEEYRLLSERRKFAMARVNDSRVHCRIAREEQFLHLEIEGASDFDTDEAIFVKYQVVTSSRWEVDTSYRKSVDNEVSSTNEGHGVMVFEGQTSPSLPLTTNIGAANGRNLASIVGALVILSVSPNVK